MGQKEGWREWIIAATSGCDHALRDEIGQKTVCLYQGVVDGDSGDALAGDPCQTPLCCTLLHTSKHHRMLAFPSDVSLWQNQKNRRV